MYIKKKQLCLCIAFGLSFNLISCSSGSTTSNSNLPSVNISALSESVVASGESTTVTISLAESSGSNVIVYFDSNNVNVLQTNPGFCILTPGNSYTCTVTLNTITPGSATFTANAQGYNSSTSPTLTSKAKYAYITNFIASYYSNVGAYTQCGLTIDGSIESSSCNNINTNIILPSGIAISNNYAYITQAYLPDNIQTESSTFTQCNVNAESIESASCAPVTITPTGMSLGGIAISNGHAYMTSMNNNSIVQCNIDNLGIESQSCSTITPTGSGALNYPAGIAADLNYVYIANSAESIFFYPTGNSYTQCPISESGMNSSGCITVIPGGSGALSSVSQVTVNSGFAYFSNTYESGYTQCAINTNGINPSSCSTVIVNSPDIVNNEFNPAGIGIYGNYAYILNANANGNDYMQCNVTANGIDQSSCSNIIVNNGNPKTLVTPNSMAFY